MKLSHIHCHWQWRRKVFNIVGGANLGIDRFNVGGGGGIRGPQCISKLLGGLAPAAPAAPLPPPLVPTPMIGYF